MSTGASTGIRPASARRFAWMPADRNAAPRALMEWIEAHPDALTQPAAEVMRKALAERFPCKGALVADAGESLPILFRDDTLIAIHKPAGLLVHRSALDRHETRFALQMLRDQIGQPVYPVHRLDKGTSGVLLFALERDVGRVLRG